MPLLPQFNELKSGGAIYETVLKTKKFTRFNSHKVDYVKKPFFVFVFFLLDRVLTTHAAKISGIDIVKLILPLDNLRLEFDALFEAQNEFASANLHPQV